jgi:hypothetical protein
MTVLSNLLFAYVGTFAAATILAGWRHYAPLFKQVRAMQEQPSRHALGRRAGALRPMRPLACSHRPTCGR